MPDATFWGASIIIFGIALVISSFFAWKALKKGSRPFNAFVIFAGCVIICLNIVSYSVWQWSSAPVEGRVTRPSITVTAAPVNLDIVRKNAVVYCATGEVIGEVIPTSAPYRYFWFQITMERPQAVIAQTVLVPGEPQLAYKSSRTFLADIRYRDLPVFSNWIHARAQEKANFADWFSQRQFKTVCFADETQAVEIMF